MLYNYWYFSLLGILLFALPVKAQDSQFRGIVTTTEYWEFPEQRLQSAVLADQLGTSQENWDTLYATYNVCSDTIVMTYHGLDRSISHMTFEYDNYSFVKFVDPARGIEFVKTARLVRDLSGATAADWKRVRNNARDSAYQKYDYRMVHPRRNYDTYYATVDESKQYDRQFQFGGYFETLFNPRGRYRQIINLSDKGKHFTDYTYSEREDLDCAAMLQGVQIRARDEELDRLLQYRPTATLIPETERQPFEAYGVLDSNAYAPIDVAAYQDNYLLIDLWATWCLPCRQEMPYLAEIVERYQGKPLKVVSVSLDGSVEEQRWREARRKLNIHWENWIAAEGMESQFAHDYVEMGIPVYLLVNPEGKVISKNAPRPSSTELVELLDKLLAATN